MTVQHTSFVAAQSATPLTCRHCRSDVEPPVDQCRVATRAQWSPDGARCDDWAVDPWQPPQGACEPSTNVQVGVFTVPSPRVAPMDKTRAA